MVKFLYNRKILRERRRSLRNNQTTAEKWLWLSLSKSQLAGFKFTRQYGVGSYILDFYCPKVRLAIEVDDDSHRKTGAKIYDEERTNYLKGLDIKVLRFTNQEVFNNLDKVLENIRSAVECAPS